MSDRSELFRLNVESDLNDVGEVSLLMDGETGTWRLFFGDAESVDLTLAQLRELHSKLGEVLWQISSDDRGWNAETRKKELIASYDDPTYIPNNSGT
jgi:hypothetical protein